MHQVMKIGPKFVYVAWVSPQTGEPDQYLMKIPRREFGNLRLRPGLLLECFHGWRCPGYRSIDDQ
jgi:hypothetical protein